MYIRVEGYAARSAGDVPAHEERANVGTSEVTDLAEFEREICDTR